MRKNIALKTRFRKIRSLLLISFLVSLFQACQQEGIADRQEENTQKISFRFSFEGGIQTGTEYETISRATGGDIDQINAFGYIVAEKLPDGKYLVEEAGTSRFIPGNIDLVRIKIGKIEATQWEAVLRPGKYAIFIFTCVAGTKWNDNIKKGVILDPANPIPAMEYKVPDTWLTGVRESLPYEVFFGSTEFAVSKKKELDDPNNTGFHVTLERRVAKFRTLLSTEPTAGNLTFADVNQFPNNMIILHTELTDLSGKGFPDGLDVFGNAYYNQLSVKNSLYMIQTVQWGDVHTLSVYPFPCYLSKPSKAIIYTSYIFTGKDVLTAEVTKVMNTIGMQGNHTECLYQGAAVHTYTIENSKVYSCMMRLTDNHSLIGLRETYELEPVLDGGTAWLDLAPQMDPNIEYD